VGPKGACCLALTAKPKGLELARLVWPCHPRPFSAHAARSGQLIALFFALIVVLTPSVALAQSRIGTCVRVNVPSSEDAEGFRQLVRSEVNRHNTHQAVEEGCTSHLVVEMFRVGKDRYVTGRMNAEVPYRTQVEGEGARPLELALEETLTVVLHNDPVRLRGPGGEAGLVGWLGKLRRRGLTIWGVQLHEMGAYANGKVHFVPGVGLMLAREAGPWQVGLGTALGVDLQGQRSSVRLASQLKVDAQLAYFFSETASTSWYAMGSFGLLHQRFEGPIEGTQGTFRDEQSASGAALSLRTGVELLRETNMRMHLFVEGAAPLYSATNEDVGLVSGWTPTMGGGVGVVF
jgi:hypothetical protein